MITLTELLNIQDSKTLGSKIFQSGGHNEVRAHLRSLVLQASLTELKQIINVFNENEFFVFLEDIICNGEVATMNEDEYWDFIGE